MSPDVRVSVFEEPSDQAPVIIQAELSAPVQTYQVFAESVHWLMPTAFGQLHLRRLLNSVCKLRLEDPIELDVWPHPHEERVPPSPTVTGGRGSFDIFRAEEPIRVLGQPLPVNPVNHADPRSNHR